MTRFLKKEKDIKDVLIIGDQLLLELVINNLLDNALKYSGNENLVIIKIFTESKFIKLQVIDEGKGISLEEQSKVFEKFYRGAQRQTKGTGLGLYLSRKIINSHNGEINVSNNSPHGCIFEIIFKMNKL